MIRFFYSGCYEGRSDEYFTPLSRFKLHVDMYSLADKYGVPKLGKVAIAHFQDALTADGTNQGDYLPVVRAIYESTPPWKDGLRRAIVKHVVNCDSLDEGKKRDSLLKATFVEVPQFGWDCFCYSTRSL